MKIVLDSTHVRNYLSRLHHRDPLEYLCHAASWYYAEQTWLDDLFLICLLCTSPPVRVMLL